MLWSGGFEWDKDFDFCIQLYPWEFEYCVDMVSCGERHEVCQFDLSDVASRGKLDGVGFIDGG